MLIFLSPLSEQRWSGDSEGQPQTSRRRKESEESESEEGKINFDIITCMPQDSHE